MFSVKSILFIAIAAQAVLSTPVHPRSSYAVKETHHVPQKWTKVGPASPGHMIHLQIAVKQGQFDELERHLYEGKRV